MSEEAKPSCDQSKEQLDLLIDSMVEARLNQAQGLESFDPQGALQEHLLECADCHNYHLANRVLIEAAKSLPRLDGGEELTSSIMAMIEEAQMAEASPQSFFARHNNVILIASFIAFTLFTSGIFTDSSALGESPMSSDWIWSSGSWALALMVVALLKPFIEGNWSIDSHSRTVKA